MNTRFILGAVAGWLVLASTAPAQSIDIDVSFKVILNPDNGSRPSGVNDNLITTKVNEMNAMLATYYRGYRLRQASAPINIGAAGDNTGPGRFFNTDFDQGGLSNLKGAIDANRTLYAWNDNAVNIYINQATFTGDSLVYPNELIALGLFGLSHADLTLHEIGHFFQLAHTQGSSCNQICPPPPGAFGPCFTQPGGDDGLTDTLPDAVCWDKNGIAQYSYGANYSALTPIRQTNVDNLFFNLMSYHINFTRDRMTELQLDLWTDTGNVNMTRRRKQSGRTEVVDRNSTAPAPNGNSTAPFATLAAGVAAASSGDILLIRPGSYNERMTITKAVTLRATRVGPVTIGN